MFRDYRSTRASEPMGAVPEAHVWSPERDDAIPEASPKPESTMAAEAADTNTLARGGAMALLGRVAGRGLLIAYQLTLARTLGPELFGIYAVGSAVMMFASNVAPIGLTSGVVRYGSMYWRSQPEKLRAVVNRCLKIGAATSLVSVVLLFAAANPLAERVFEMPGLAPVLRWLAVACGAGALMRVAASATRITQRMGPSVTSVEIVRPVAGLVLFGLLYATFGSDPRAAAAATAGSFVVGLAVALTYVRGMTRRAQQTQSRNAAEPLASVATAGVGTRELLAYSLPASMAAVFSMQAQRIDRLLVGYYHTSMAAGIYQAAADAASLMLISITAFNAVFGPMIGALHAKGEIERLRSVYRTSARWGFYLSVPLFLTIAMAPHRLVNLLYGERFAAAVVPLLILTSAQLLKASVGGVGLLLTITGDHKRWFVASASMLAANTILGMIFVPRYGLVGAAGTTARDL